MLDVIIKPNTFDNKSSNIQNLNQQIPPTAFLVHFISENGLGEFSSYIFMLIPL